MSEHRTAGNAPQDSYPDYEGHGLVNLEISGAALLINGTPPSAAIAKRAEDLATAKTIIRHRMRCAAIQRRQAGRPFDWAKLLLTLGVVDAPLVCSKPTKVIRKKTPRAKQKNSVRPKKYNKPEMNLVEQIARSLGCSESTARDVLRQIKVILKGLKIAVPGRRRDRWVPYPAPRLKSSGIKKP